ncbi:MAG: hypothetical protein WD250_00275 [Egibacteraceae bacterium]
MPANAVAVSVNLLPQEQTERLRARRVTQYTAGAVLLLVGLMGAGYVLRLVEVGHAEEARDVAEAEVARLQTEVAELAEYGELAEFMENRDTLLASAMEHEIAFSEVLNELSLAFPSHASLRSLTIAANDGADSAQDSAIDFGESVATAEFSGYSVERVAPGVETVIVDFDRAGAFFNTFVTTASAPPDADTGATDVTDFAGTVTLDRDAYTGRYADGLPTEATP